MGIMKARIVWFPKLLTSVTHDKLEDQIPWKQEHLIDVKKYMKEDGLLFPGVIFKDEIHCGHYRFRVAKEMGHNGIEVYEANNYEHVLKLTKFTELCYKHYKEIKNFGYL
jgi:hypothetical protein